MKRTLLILLCILAAVLLCSCEAANSTYNKTHNIEYVDDESKYWEGYDDGYENGKESGYEYGFEDGKSELRYSVEDYIDHAIAVMDDSQNYDEDTISTIYDLLCRAKAALYE